MRTLLFLGLLFLFGNCAKESPQFTIDDQKLVEILTDLHVAEASLSKVPLLQKDSVSTVLKKVIADVHGMSEADLDYNIELLQRMPSKQIELYDSVMSHFDNLKKELDESRKPGNKSTTREIEKNQ